MPATRPHRIVVAEPFDEDAVERLRGIAEVSVLEDSAPAAVIAAVPEADALLVRARAHVTARVINAAPNLKVIGRAGPNTDHIDLRAAGRRNIQVVYAPHVAVSSSAEFALALILAIHRKLFHFNRFIRQGQFEGLRAPSGHDFARQVVGLLGLDPVAQALGRICQTAFGCRLIYHDPTGAKAVEFEGEPVDLEALLGESDILSIHLRRASKSDGLMSAERLALMKSTAILVNISRGAVVDTRALAAALRAGQLAGAGLDVFEAEPLPADHPIRLAPNCILTPHVSGHTLDAAARRFDVADDVIRVLNGEAPHFPAPVPAT